jgi:hypothetical protein
MEEQFRPKETVGGSSPSRGTEISAGMKSPYPMVIALTIRNGPSTAAALATR